VAKGHCTVSYNYAAVRKQQLDFDKSAGISSSPMKIYPITSEQFPYLFRFWVGFGFTRLEDLNSINRQKSLTEIYASDT